MANDVSPHDFMAEIRRDLHMHPELGRGEHRTSEKVAAILDSLGIEVHRGIGGAGVVGILKNGRGNGSIGLRADMDALPITEIESRGYRSKNEGVMHACGHDGHTAMLLGAARDLSKSRSFDGTVVFIFQPDEENGTGAKSMIDGGLLTKFPIDEVYAFHNLPGAPVGEMSTRVGTICSSESLFEIGIRGQGGHAAMPQKGVDAILVGSEIVQALQHIVSRKVDPGCGAVVSVTEFITDGRRNVLPGHGLIKGEVRARAPSDREQVMGYIARIADAAALRHDVGVSFDHRTDFAETINSAETVRTAKRAASAAGLKFDDDRQPMSFSEDFGVLSSAVPGCFLLIGNGTDGANGQPLHSNDYDFNDRLLVPGASFWKHLIGERLPVRL